MTLQQNKVKRSSKFLQFILREAWMTSPNLMAVHPIVVRTFPLKTHPSIAKKSPKRLPFRYSGKHE